MRGQIKKIIAKEIIHYFTDKKICCKWEFYKDDIVAVWVGGAKLFAYLCWRTTNLCVKNGLNIYRGKKNIDYDIFLQQIFNSNDINIDRTSKQEFEMGILPQKQKYAKRYKMIDEGLNKVLKNLFVDYKE